LLRNERGADLITAFGPARPREEANDGIGVGYVVRDGGFVMRRRPAPRARGGGVELFDLEPAVEAFADAVLAGLARPQKSIPAKYFYDARGAKLFEAICALDEYYPTRTEIGILHAHARALAEWIGEDSHLIEFGSGNSFKVGILLRALRRPQSYVAIDISRDSLMAGADVVATDHPAVRVIAVCADYTHPLRLPELPPGPRLGFFPGSTIGNFTPGESVAFLKTAAGVVAGGGLLIGVDLKKDPAVLHAAYNDSKGVTAEFNLNLLRRVNAELGGTFDLAAFSHHAFYDPEKGRIEMHLVSKKPQRVRVMDRAFAFAAGETIHTENSYKYTVEEFQALAREAGFTPASVWIDDDRLFSVHHLKAP
jgi:dimethylhistidine N-methyltransferase